MLFKLALSVIRFEKLLSFVFVVSLMAVLSPLMILWSLKSGVIYNLEHQIVDNPANFEVIVAGNNNGNELYDLLKDDEHTGFIIYKTRSLSSEVELKPQGGSSLKVPLYPTGEGDPLALYSNIDSELEDEEIILSGPLSKSLGVKAGDTVSLAVRRVFEGRNELSAVTFKVKGVLDDALSSRQVAYVSLNALCLIEDYKDGYNPPLFSDGTNPNLDRTRYGSVRLYAKDLDSIIPLCEKLRANRFEILNAQIDKVQNLQAVSAVLNSIYFTVAAVSLIGGIAAAFGLIYATLANRSRTMAMLQVMGLGKMQLCALVAIKNSLCGVLSFILSYAFCMGAALFLNNLYAQALSGAQVAMLPPAFMLCCFVLSQAVLLLSSVWCMKLIYFKRETAQLLRD